MNQRILACMLCIGACFYVLTGLNYPWQEIIFDILIGVCAGKIVAMFLITKGSYAPKTEYEKYVAKLNMFEPVVAALIILAAYNHWYRDLPMYVGILFYATTSYPLHLLNARINFNGQLVYLGKLNLQQREYILLNIEKILGYPLEPWEMTTFQQFFFEKDLYANRKNFPPVDHLLYDIAKKVHTFWRDHERVKMEAIKLAQHNREATEGEKAAFVNALAEFKKKWNVSGIYLDRN